MMNAELNVNAELVAHAERMAKHAEEQACIDAAAERIWKAWTEWDLIQCMITEARYMDMPSIFGEDAPKVEEPIKPIKYEGRTPLNRFYINAVNEWYEDGCPDEYEEANGNWKFKMNELRQMNFKFDHALFYCEDGFNTAKGAVECEYMDVHDASPTYIRIFDDLIDVDGSGVEVECEVAHLMQRILVCGGYYDAEGEYDNDDDRYNDVANCLQVHLYVVKRPDGTSFVISREDYERIVHTTRMEVVHVRHPRYSDYVILIEDGSANRVFIGVKDVLINGSFTGYHLGDKTADQYVNELIGEHGAWRVKRSGSKLMTIKPGGDRTSVEFKITALPTAPTLVLE